jgi:hypothetical protein
MSGGKECRTEDRLEYKWPVLFSQDFTKRVDQGLMVDVSSGGIAFDYNNCSCCLQPGQELTVKFSLPRSDKQDPTAVISITRTGRICRVEKISESIQRIALQFDKPLSLKPCELADIELMRNSIKSS